MIETTGFLCDFKVRTMRSSSNVCTSEGVFVCIHTQVLSLKIGDVQANNNSPAGSEGDGSELDSIDLGPLNKFRCSLCLCVISNRNQAAKKSQQTAAKKLRADEDRDQKHIPSQTSHTHTHRWDDTPQAVRLDRLPHTPHTPTLHLWDVDFTAVAASSGPSLQGITPAADLHTPGDTAADLHTDARGQSHTAAGSSVAASGSSAAVVASVPACKQGVLNSVAMWFTLHLDDSTSISTAPSEGGGVKADGCEGKGEQECQRQKGCADDKGQQNEQQSKPAGSLLHWGQALMYLDSAMVVQPGQVGAEVACF